MGGALNSASVLVVDDDPGILRLIEKSLRREGCATYTAASGQETLDWLGKTRPDLMLLDLKLSDQDGREVLQRLASAGQSVPFIIITGQGDERVAVEVMKLGALDYLVKDANLPTLVPAVVAKALDQIARDRRLTAAEAALRLSEEHYRMLFQHNPLPTWVIDLESLAFLAVNRAAIEHYGYSESEFLSLTIKDLGLPGESQRWSGKLLELTGHSIWKQFKKDGTAIEIELVFHPLEFQGRDAGLVVARDITDQKRLEREVVEISHQERQRIGQDLHDGLGQQLAGIEFMLHSLEQQLAARSKKQAAVAAEIAGHVRQAIAQARGLARGVSPVELDAGGLVAALQALATSVENLFKVECQFRCDAPMVINDHTAATHLYRITQEAINNAIRHGRARCIVIQLSSGSAANRLSIESDGLPFPENPDKTGGMGLRIMRYRARQFDGQLEFRPVRRAGHDRPEGARVTCEFRKHL